MNEGYQGDAKWNVLFIAEIEGIDRATYQNLLEGEGGSSTLDCGGDTQYPEGVWCG